MTDTTQNATLIAGTSCYFRVVGEGNGLVELEGVRALGKIGTTGSYVDQSTLKDKTKRYIGGVKDTEESTLKLANYPDDENQQAFISAAQQSKSMEFKVVYPVDGNGKQLVALFEIATSGYGIPEASDANTLVEFDISYRMSGKPDFALATDGNTASMSEVTVATDGDFGGLSGDVILMQGREFTTNGKGVSATLLAAFINGSISSATILKGGMGHKVGDTLTVVSGNGAAATNQAELTISKVG